MPEPPPRFPSPSSFAWSYAASAPLIWRRVLVRSDSTIADLHVTLQLVFGWSDEHLHRFVVHGRQYGISYAGGLSFRDDPHEVRLADLGLRAGERFVYEYDFTDGWCHKRASGADPAPGDDQALPGLHRRPASRPSGGLRRSLELHGASAA